MNIPMGFRFAGVKAGIKPNRRDLALIVSDHPCSAAGQLTVNLARAWPVLACAARLPSSVVRAIVANSGNANALTGPTGAEDERAMAAAVASALGLEREAVLTASTGVIGVRLPATRVEQAAPDLVRSLGPDPDPAAEAIMTTDTRKKSTSRVFVLDGRTVTISAICKGSGMIHPQMATMLCFVTTDAAISPLMLDEALRRAVDESFNTITVDGDMSTNDCVLALANGQARHAPITGAGPHLEEFTRQLTDLCQELARAIAADGEGATKLLVVKLSGAPDREAARELARCAAGSNLVKAAIFGGDPNWGRILAAIGARAGQRKLAIDPARARMTIQGFPVYGPGGPAEKGPQLNARMREPEITVEVDLGAGPASATALGCDLSYDYVKINADYVASIVETQDGGVARDDKLQNYTPGFKRALLVEALSYIKRFSGRRAVIKYGGAAMIEDRLKRSFAQDIILLKSVGLAPIVVHGGGPEITHVLDKLGHMSEFVDGMRVTGAQEVKVAEMVLSGQLSGEIVGLVNAAGGSAVGLSGKDGNLFSARKLEGKGGRDLGFVGEITAVNREFLEMLLAAGHIPVISPIGFGPEGQTFNINADSVAAEIAVATGATKCIFLTDVPGILDENGLLISELSAPVLEGMIGDGVKGGMHVKAQSILRALAGGVERVHVVDGRVPHNVVAELFTDRGVGTLVTR